MTRRRFFIPPDRIRDGIAILTADQAHHLRAVLRLRTGDAVELFDGEGRAYTGEVECHGGEIRITALDRISLPEKGDACLILAPALIRLERFEWLLEKGTELGIDRFLPLETHFTSVRVPPAGRRRRLERWQRIVREASKQCRRLTVPGVCAPQPAMDLLTSRDHADCTRFLLDLSGPERLSTAGAPRGTVLLCIGPEGGWHGSEVEAARGNGWKVVRLGPGILRAETAGLAAVAVLRFILDE